MELKAEHRRVKISKVLVENIGHQPSTGKEKRLHAAAIAISAGDKPTDVEKLFAVSQGDIQNYISRAFPDDQDRFKFLEECAISNAIIAQGHFAENYRSLTPEGSARAFGIFAEKALAIRKARESGFQEAPVNVAILLNLQQTLEKLTPPTSPQI